MSNTLDDMLDDAKILADYGWRSGKLKDARLFEAIGAFEKLDTRTWRAPETANLQEALNEAVVAIDPTTLSDIKLRNPFVQSSRPDTIKRFALIAFSILLMVLTARFTILYNTGVELAASLEEINDARPAEKMAAVARQWLSASDEPGSNETYYRLLDELRELDSDVRAYSAGYAEYREAVQWWTPWTYLFQQPLPQAPPGSADGAAQPVEYPQISCGMTPKGFGAMVPSPDDFAGKPPGSILNSNKELIANFACTEALAITPYSMPVLVAGGADIRNILKVLGLWLLPGFYGALGATISYMRAILNPVLPDPPMDRIVHRIALGGFAGIIFAWFWAPSTAATDQFVGLTINSFAVAFIIGFSIDVLFALLDTVVRLLQNFVNQIGQAGPAPAAVAAGGRGGASRPPLPQPPPQPASPVVRGLDPGTVTRAAEPRALTLTGDGLADVRSILVRKGDVAVAATDIRPAARKVDFSVVLDSGQPAGDWTLEVTDAGGASIAVPWPLTVT